MESQLNQDPVEAVKPASYSTKQPGLIRLQKVSLAKSKHLSGESLKKPVLIVACLLAGIIGGLAGSQINQTNPSNASTELKQQYISNESELIAEIAKITGQSVVSVEVTTQSTGRDIFGFAVPQQQQGAGTGFIISDSGVIVTNRHVVPAGTEKVTVVLADGTTYEDVEVIGRTSQSSSLDVAFLKIKDLKGKKLTAIKIGDSAKMEIGYRVIAIGNALGQFQNTVTSGILSGYGRDLTASDASGANPETLTDLFQTDAAINQGNSGGPLVNINGEVIGINTAVAGNADNIGFAIPINDVKGLITSVLEKGELLQPYLGVRYVSLTDDLAYQYNLTVNRGAYIAPSDSQRSSILAGSPAEKAGLKEKDIIAKVNDINIDDKTSLTSALSRFKVGDEITLSIVRDGNNQEVKVRLEAAPSS